MACGSGQKLEGKRASFSLSQQSQSVRLLYHDACSFDTRCLQRLSSIAQLIIGVLDASRRIEFRKITSIATSLRKQVIPKLLTIHRLQPPIPSTTRRSGDVCEFGNSANGMRCNAPFGLRHTIGHSQRATRTKTSPYPCDFTMAALGHQCSNDGTSFRSLVGTSRKWRGIGTSRSLILAGARSASAIDLTRDCRRFNGKPPPAFCQCAIG
jgi:hypothetical protein